MIVVSLFSHAKDNEPKRQEYATWSDFVAALGPHQYTVAEKKRVPMFSPAEFEPGRPRKKDYALRAHFGVLDCDMISTDQVIRLSERLQGLNAILYTTYTHAKVYQLHALWKLRVCIELTRPIEKTEYPAFWGSLTTYFLNLNDPECKDIGHGFFAPFVPPDTPRDLVHWVVFKGAPLDVAALPLMALQAPVEQGTEHISRDRLQRIAARWKRSRDLYRSEMGVALERVCKGEVFAEPGNVDNMLFSLAQDLCKEVPNVDPVGLARHFCQSLQLMAEGRGNRYLGVDGPNEELVSKFGRAQTNAAAEAMALEVGKANESKLRIRQAFAHVDPEREYPYTTFELSQMALELKCAPEEMRKRWLIQRGSIFYVLGPLCTYSPPYTERDVMNAVVRDLAPAHSAGVDLWLDSDKDTPMRKPLTTLMAEYGTVATDYVIDLRAQKPSYDPIRKLMIEAPCPVRDLEPTYDPQVALWLELLTDKCFQDVCTWLALVTELDSTCAALFLEGAKDTGKSLFAFGVARLWAVEGPTSAESAMSNFNAAIRKNPLVFADEKLPEDWRGKGRTKELRRFISDMARPFNQKFMPESTIVGAIRMVIAANSPDILAINENLSAHDIDAIADRIYHIKVNPIAAEYLATIDARSFVRQDRIAKHALWLKDNHAIKREGRFQIRDRNPEFHRGLTTRSGIRSAVCQWLVGYLKSPARANARGDFGVWVKDGKLYVRVETILEYWDSYVPNEQVPTTGLLAHAIGHLSLRREHKTKPDGRGSAHYRVIDTTHLYAWAAQTEYMTRPEIDAALSYDTENLLANRA